MHWQLLCAQRGKKLGLGWWAESSSKQMLTSGLKRPAVRFVQLQQSLVLGMTLNWLHRVMFLQHPGANDR